MKKLILIAGAIYFGFGFLIGALVTADGRTSTHYIKNSVGGLDSVSDNISGCVYKSYASFLSPGYVIACELFRKRFEIEHPSIWK